MKRSIGIVSLCVVLSLLMIPAGSSMAQTSLTYDSCIQVQNLSATAADIVLRYYEQGNTTPVAEPTDTIAGSGAKNYCPLSAVSDGFNGSVVIESTAPVVAIVNVTGGAWNAHNASYAGFDSGANTVSLPLLHYANYGYYTWYNVQNVGSATADVDVTYSDGVQVLNTAIQPGLAVTFDQANEAGHAAGVFAGTVTSDQPIVVTVMQVGPTMLFGYNGFTTTNQNPVMPTVMANNYGYSSSINLQNTGAVATTVTISYSPSTAGTACTQTKTIQPGDMGIFALLAWAASDTNADNTCVNGETFVGSAKVLTNSAGQELAAIVNQHHFGTNKGAAYSGFGPDAASSTVVMPLIMQFNWGYWTAFNVQNVGTQPTSVLCTFTDSTYTQSTPSALDPGAAYTFQQYNTPLGPGPGFYGPGYVGSATCTASGGDEKIIAVVNQLRTAGTKDTFLVYEGFNISP